jgi:SAM-dependent methyltransferase
METKIEPEMQSEPNETKTFFHELVSSLRDGSFIELLLTKYRGKEKGLQKILIRTVTVKRQPHLSFVYRYETQDITKNRPIVEGLESIPDLLGSTFRSAHLFTVTQDLQLEFSKRGKLKLGRAKPSREPGASSAQAHDRQKHRYVDQTRPFLQALGVTDAEYRIVPAMARKWKQINKFVEIFEHALTSSDLAGRDRIDVIDFGSGKGYLTFAIYDYLQSVLEIETSVTGVELRANLVSLCSDLAEKLGMNGLRFRIGDVRSSPPETMDALIALHACDTATDLALHLGIRSGAGIILCSPCCHKEIRRQIQSPEILLPMLKYGVHLGQEADMVTDALRALLLEAHGYKTQILEFVSLEHTSKNKMILAVRGTGTAARDEILAQVAELKAFYGIEHQMLETLLEQAPGSNPAS